MLPPAFPPATTSQSERLVFRVSWWVIFVPFVSEFQPSQAWALHGDILQQVHGRAALEPVCAGGEAVSGSPFPFSALCGVFPSRPFPHFNPFFG